MSRVIKIVGFNDCSYFQKAADAGKKLYEAHPDVIVEVEGSTRDEYLAKLVNILRPLNKGDDSHKTSPIVYLAERNKPLMYIGGCDSFLNYCRTDYELDI